MALYAYRARWTLSKIHKRAKGTRPGVGVGGADLLIFAIIFFYFFLLVRLFELFLFCLVI